MIFDYLVRHILKMNHLDSVLSLNEKQRHIVKKHAQNQALAQAPAGASPEPPRKMNPEWVPVHGGQKLILVREPRWPGAGK